MAAMTGFGTRLSSIPAHHIHVECVCGHSAEIEVTPLLQRMGNDATVRDVLALVRCSACHARQIRHARIIYSGGSDVALKGTAFQPK